MIPFMGERVIPCNVFKPLDLRNSMVISSNGYLFLSPEKYLNSNQLQKTQ